MALVSLNAVRKSFGSRTVLDGLDFAIEPGARVGVVGANGSGKSTMLRLIAGLEEPDAGTSVRRRGIVVSFLPQHPLGDERNALETVRAARPDLDELDRRAAPRSPTQLAVARARGRPRPDVRACSAARRSSSSAGRRPAGRASTAAARAMLLDLGLDGGRPGAADERALGRPAEADRARRLPRAGSRRPPARRAGGAPRRRRPLAARAPARRAFDGAVVAVSHDRYLLDETVSQIAELDRGRIRMWPGNYSAYTLARELELQRQQQQLRHPAEGDRAARGGDPPLQGLGAAGRRRAPHQAGAEQAAPDRPDGEGRAAGARAAQDRASAAPARARRPARLRAAPRRHAVRRATSCSPTSS